MNNLLISTSFCVLIAVSQASGRADLLTEVGSVRNDGTLFLSCVDVASALDYEFKVVTPNRLVTFCQGGANGTCLPIRLTEQNHRDSTGGLMVAADVLRSGLQFSVSDTSGRVAIKRIASSESSHNASPAYNALWPPGRGFREGSTVPDIPLIGLDGDEVRFSQFLGKRYILYCWASW